MMRFIRFFISNWKDYPIFRAFCETRPRMMAEARASGDYIYKGRFDYAWRNTRLYYKHYKEERHAE